MTARHAWWYGCAVLYLWTFAHVALLSWRHPMLNWDMVAYMGVAESYSDADPQHIYDNTMARVRRFVSPGRYRGITEGNRLSASPDAFFEQLPLYKVKPIYTGAMWLFDRLGLPLHVASYALSIAGFVATGLLCFFLVPRGADPGLWWLSVLAFCAMGRWSYDALPAWSTPDTLYTAFFLAAFALWAYRRSAWGLGIFLLLAQLTRPDMLMLTPPLLLFFALDPAQERLPWRAAAVIFTVNAAAGWLVSHLAGHYGYLAQFFYTFVYKSAYPASIVPDLGAGQFLAIVWDGVRHMLQDRRIHELAALSLLALLVHWRRPAGKAWFAHLLLLSWLALAARFVLYPAWWEDRYYFPYYFMMLYGAAEILLPYAQALMSRGARRTDRTPAASA